MKFIISALLILVSSTSFAAKDVHTSQIEYIYQLDSSPTEFEFSISTANLCGSNLYRVKSPNEAVANRKFAIALLAFHDTEECKYNRSVVKWVRITK
jgi:hypothetical protein